MQFNHLALRVKSLETMLAFYSQQLGFEEAFKIYNDDGSVRIVYLHISGEQYLELCAHGEHRPAFDDQRDLGFRHWCLSVDDIYACRQQLIEKGIRFDSEILEMRDANLAMYLFDPEGNKLEIVQTSPRSPQFAFQQRLQAGLT